MRLGNLRTLLLAAAGLAHGAAGRAAAPPAATTTATTLHFATKPFAPYSYAGADGRAAGPLVELLHAACAEAGWRCTVELLPWRRALAMAERGELDGVFPVVDSPARRQAFHLSPVVVPGRYALYARPGSAPGEPAPRLAGRTVAAYGPSDAASTLRQLGAAVPGLRIEIEPDHQTALRKLAAGRYGEDGLVLANEAAAGWLPAEPGPARLRQVGVVKEVVYAFAFVPQRIDAARLPAFAAALLRLCRSGRTAALFKPHGLTAAACLQPS